MRIRKTVGHVELNIDTKFDSSVREAQMLLNEQIVDDCERFIPKQQGWLRDSVRYPEGPAGGVIEWNSPYAHYQYIGKVRTDENGRVFVGKGEKKPVLTERELEYHEPGTTSHWFEKAKAEHEGDWIKLVEETIGRKLK